VFVCIWVITNTNTNTNNVLHFFVYSAHFYSLLYIFIIFTNKYIYIYITKNYITNGHTFFHAPALYSGSFCNVFGKVIKC